MRSELGSRNRSLVSLVERAGAQRRALLSGFACDPSGDRWCRQHSALADGLVRSLFRTIPEASQAGAEIAVVAVGGYGRRELAPRSDIDITFVPLYEHNPASEDPVRAMFRALIEAFSALEWPVGYSYRLVSDCPALDPATRTGLLDARLICGSKRALDRLLRAFWDSFPAAEFLISKLDERREQRSKWHDTPRVVEFHLRDGAGGLRDLQTARWAGRVLGFRPSGALAAERELLLKVRNAVHIVTGRKEDRLIRTRIREVAEMLYTSAEELAADLMRAGEAVALEWKRTEERLGTARFRLARGVLADQGACRISQAATLADAAVGVCSAVRLGLAIRRTSPPKAWGDAPVIVQCLTSGEKALRGLDEAGLLDQLIPELGACRYVLSRDAMHRYSVGEHSLRVVAALDAAREMPEFEAPRSEMTNLRPLYLAALLHDAGKVEANRPHTEAGAELAAKVCDRLGIEGDERETTVWLVREHLTFAQIARTHDLAQPQTAFGLARLCGRPDRLAMLYLLTYADTCSVDENAWTPQTGAAAADLYAKARRALGIEAPPDDPALYRSEAVRRLQRAQGTEGGVEELLEAMPTHYLLATPLDLFPLHAEYVREAREGEMTVTFQNQPDTHTTDITICMCDLPRPGLLSRILGVVYALDLTVHTARAASTKGPKRVALDVLSVSFQGRPLPPPLCRIVSAELMRCLTDAESLEALLRAHGKDPDRRQAMLTHRFHEGELGVLEIETPLGRGMPYRVAKMLAGFGWNIQVARIGQWAGRAVARFYLDLPSGKKLTDRQVSRALKSGAPAPPPPP